MDSAYDAPINQGPQPLVGHVPIIDSHTRRGAEKQHLAHERNVIRSGPRWKSYGRLKEEFGGRWAGSVARESDDQSDVRDHRSDRGPTDTFWSVER